MVAEGLVVGLVVVGVLEWRAEKAVRLERNGVASTWDGNDVDVEVVDDEPEDVV